LTGIVDGIFNNVKYWQNKNLLLQAINPDYYRNKNIMIRLLGVTSQSISPSNEAKKNMWNHMLINENLGDNILKLIDKNILDDIEFVKAAICKYNRVYVYASHRLKASRELALLAAMAEKDNDGINFKNPILKYMPDTFKKDNEIAVMATTRNINNLEYASNLRKNKYFIMDIMNIIDDHNMKQKILKYIDPDLLNDKKFVSRLGCFDNMCEKYRGDTEFVASAVRHDISILKKTEIFDESIIKGALKNNDIYTSRETAISAIFRYIERFNHGYDELDSKIKNKNILHNLFWIMGETITDEFI
jgi:predicted XRE-type DNA-binding protein